ncbi:MAG: DUF6478 family protein [Pseudomonadota bacterium]
MLSRIALIFETLLHRLATRMLTRRAKASETADPLTVRRWRRQAREMQIPLSRLERTANTRLQGPAILSEQAELPAGPKDASLRYRPPFFTQATRPSGLVRPASATSLGGGITLHHDLEEPELSLRQVRNGVATGLTSHDDAATPFGCLLEAFELRGSFLSLAIAIPPKEAQKTRREDLVRLTYDLELDLPLEVFARLNLRHGPNVEQIVREIDLQGRESFVEFDLFYTKYEPERGRDIWVDLIFQTPTMNIIRIRDLTIIRRPRVSL